MKPELEWIEKRIQQLAGDLAEKLNMAYDATEPDEADIVLGGIRYRMNKMFRAWRELQEWAARSEDLLYDEDDDAEEVFFPPGLRDELTFPREAPLPGQPDLMDQAIDEVMAKHAAE